MGAIQWMGLACLGAASCAAVAGPVPPPAGQTPHAIVFPPGVGMVPGLGETPYEPPGRLRYLDSARCRGLRACSGTPGTAGSRPRYARALSLGRYGPMDVKFTGDRVKVRVSF